MICREKRTPRSRPIEVKEGNTRVKIYSGVSHGYDLFTLSYYEAGKRVRKAFGNLDEAKKEASLVAKKLESGQHGVLKLTAADREAYVLATKELKPLGVPLHLACREYAEAVKLLAGASLVEAAREYSKRHGGGITKKTVPEVVEEFLARKKQEGMSKRYTQTLDNHLNRFARAMQVPITSVTAKMIDSWLDRALVTGKAMRGRGRNNVRFSIVALFRWARDHGYLQKNERTEAEGVRVVKDKGGEIGYLRPADLEKLLRGGKSKEGEELKPTEEAILFIAIGAFSGLRRAEMMRLEWEDINFEQGYIEVGKHKAKTATRRLVPIQPCLAQWITPYSKTRGKLFSSSEWAGRRVFAYGHALGVTWPSNALRHSYGSYRLAITHDAAKVALEMGNSPTMLFANYREIVTEKDAKLWFSVVPGEASNVLQMEGVAA